LEGAGLRGYRVEKDQPENIAMLTIRPRALAGREGPIKKPGNNSEISPREFDLRLAELIDNSIDGFVHAARSSAPIDASEVAVALPMADNKMRASPSRITAPGMVTGRLVGQ
jgi:hypothetical protein